MKRSSIEWLKINDKLENNKEIVGATWNPIIGCTRANKECINCYAEKIAGRFSKKGLPYYGFAESKNKRQNWTGKVEVINNKIEDPLRFRKRSIVFVNSMSDLFHEKIAYSDILRIFETMNKSDKNIFIILTKRSKRLLEFSLSYNNMFSDNIWAGVSSGSIDSSNKIKNLIKCNFKNKILSAEPLLEDITKVCDFSLEGIKWVIAGGESGGGFREMKEEWAISLRNECIKENIPFFLKQLGGHPDKRSGEKAILQGKLFVEHPQEIINFFK